MSWGSILIPSNMATTSACWSAGPALLVKRKMKLLLCVWQVGCGWAELCVFMGGRRRSPSKFYCSLKTHRNMFALQQILDVTPGSSLLLPFHVFSFQSQLIHDSHNSLEAGAWETTLLDAAATPNDHLSPPCPACCQAICPVLQVQTVSLWSGAYREIFQWWWPD